MKGFILKEENCVKLLWTDSHLCHSHSSWNWSFQLLCNILKVYTSSQTVLHCIIHQCRESNAVKLCYKSYFCCRCLFTKIKSKYAHQIKIPVFRFYNKQTNYTGETDLLNRPLHWLMEAFRSNLTKNRQSMSLETNCCIQILFKSKDSHSLPHSCQQTAQHWWLSNVAQYLLFILHTDFADELMTDLAGCD